MLAAAIACSAGAYIGAGQIKKKEPEYKLPEPKSHVLNDLVASVLITMIGYGIYLYILEGL